jgi:hypothetical protein
VETDRSGQNAATRDDGFAARRAGTTYTSGTLTDDSADESARRTTLMERIKAASTAMRPDGSGSARATASVPASAPSAAPARPTSPAPASPIAAPAPAPAAAPAIQVVEVPGPRPRPSAFATLSLIVGLLAAVAIAPGQLDAPAVGLGVIAALVAAVGLSATGRRHVTGRGEAMLGLLLGLAAIVFGAFALTGAVRWLTPTTNLFAELHVWLQAHASWMFP